MNRRSILGMMAAAAAQNMPETVGLAISSGNPNRAMEATASNAALIPKMDRPSALRMVFGDAQAMAEIRSELMQQEMRSVTYIDPDIMHKKSWSPMAKVAFQRQRNVERAIADLENERWDVPQRFIKALGTRLDKLMWGI